MPAIDPHLFDFLDPKADEPPPPPPPPPRPTKLLCLIRHGQGKHNPRKNPLALEFVPAMLKRDASLTDKGKRQAQAIAGSMQALPFELIVVSPLTRTIQTATEIFGASDAPKMLCALAIERCTMPSDVGTPRSQLLQRHPAHRGLAGRAGAPGAILARALARQARGAGGGGARAPVQAVAARPPRDVHRRRRPLGLLCRNDAPAQAGEL
jgi:hypothetical protein